MYGIENQASSLILSNDAHHTWKFADLHMQKTLKKHSAASGLQPESARKSQNGNFLTHVENVSLEDSHPPRRPVDIIYRVYREMPVKVEILNLHGDYVTTLRHDKHLCGRHELHWEGRNANGHWAASGVYFLQISTANGSIRNKFVLLR